MRVPQECLLEDTRIFIVTLLLKVKKKIHKDREISTIRALVKVEDICTREYYAGSKRSRS